MRKIFAAIFIVIVVIITISLYMIKTYYQDKDKIRDGITQTIEFTQTNATSQQVINLVQIVDKSYRLKTLSIAIGSDITTLDIAKATAIADFEVLGNVFEALFKINVMWVNGTNKLIYTPWLVSQYYQINETFWVFRLRDGVLFHNNKKLTSYDVNASIIRAIKVGGIPKQLFVDADGKSVIEHIAIYNESVFAIKLKTPFAPLVEHLAHLSMAIMPKEIAEKYMDNIITNISDVIGTGPYRINEWNRGHSIILTRFSNYWRGLASVEEVRYLVVRDINARVATLTTGQADIVVGLTPELAEKLISDGYNVIRTTVVRHVIVAINTQRIPDPRVRCALNYAIDKKAIVENILKGNARISDSVVSTTFPGIKSLKSFEYNLTKALSLLSEAESINKTLVMLISAGRPKDAEVAEAIRYYLKNIGINVEIIPLEHAAFLKKVFTEHEFDLALYGPSPSSAYYGLTYWRTSSYLNGPQYSNPEVDKLLDVVAQELNENKRHELYNKIQEIIWRDCPAIWLYYDELIVATKPEIRHLIVMPIQKLQLDEIIGLG